jgi:FAD/FMN-containing dehydrogenase
MVAPYPRVEGVWVVDPEQRADLGRNFGRQNDFVPSVALQPASVADIVAAVSWASSVGLPVAARGQAHSTHLQIAVPGGLLIDMRSLRSVSPVKDGSVSVQTGACWGDVLTLTLEQGMAPPTLTDYQRLSVGGTLSVGGIGGESFRWGAQIDNVQSLEVVTPSGRLVWCSPGQDSELFHACLGGLGQFGVITAAELAVVQAPAFVETTFISVDTLARVLQLLGELLGDPAYDHLYCNIYEQSIGWRYEVVASRYLPEPGSPVAHSGDARRSVVRSFRDFCFRVDAFVQGMQESQQWELAHPWFDVFLPWDAALDAVAGELDQLQDGSLGGGSVLLYPVRGGAGNGSRLALPNSGRCLLFDVLRNARQHDSSALAKNRAAFERCRRVGGTLYPIGSMPMDAEDWRQHWGERYPGLAELKRGMDPDGLFGRGHRVFEE